MLGSHRHHRRLPSPLDPLWFTLEDHAVARLWADEMRSYGIRWSLQLDHPDKPELGLIWNNGQRTPELRIWRDACGVRLQDMTVSDVPPGTAATMARALGVASSLLASKPGMAAALQAQRKVILYGPGAALPWSFPGDATKLRRFG